MTIGEGSPLLLDYRVKKAFGEQEFLFQDHGGNEPSEKPEFCCNDYM